MKNILSGRQLLTLRRYAASQVLLAFDMDGTLAPMVSEPEGAQVRARTRELLRRVALLYPTAIISGRSRASATKLIWGVPVRYVIGNHGLEWPRPIRGQARIAARVRGWKKELRPALAALSGVELEDKRYSLSAHYRRAANPRRAREAILAAASGLEGCRTVAGVRVVNFVAREAPDKGDALRRLMQLTRCPRAIFVGDDVTDEDIFSLQLGGRLLGIRVGSSTRSRAAYYVRDQAAVDQLLLALYQARFERPLARRPA